MKILNLYAGIGGNRKLWGNDHEITSVEYNEEIAMIYKDYFPDDNLVVGDAHEYLLDHYNEFDFIWSSRPCQTHSRARMWTSKGGRYRPKYPDLALYEEILFLQHFAECKWVAENVIPYYEPMIKPTAQIDRHLFWSNFKINPVELERSDNQTWSIVSSSVQYGFDVSKYKIKHRKDQILRNCVDPELGLYILEQAQGVIRNSNTKSLTLFD